MSLNYWSMKLGNSFVKYKGDFHRILDIQSNKETLRPKFPEDILPDINFLLDNDKLVKFDDFEIAFPDDQALVLNKRLKFIKRSMSRQYKLAPTGEIYGLRATDMKQVLKFNENPEYSPAEEVMLLDSTDRVFSKNVGIISRTRSNSTKDVLYCGKRVCTLTHKKGLIELIPIIEHLPSEVSNLFEEYLNVPIPYIGKNKAPDKKKLNLVRFINVRERESLDSHRRSHSMVYYERDTLSHIFSVPRDGGNSSYRFVVANKHDLHREFVMDNISLNEYSGAIDAIPNLRG